MGAGPMTAATPRTPNRPSSPPVRWSSSRALRRPAAQHLPASLAASSSRRRGHQSRRPSCSPPACQPIAYDACREIIHILPCRCQFWRGPVDRQEGPIAKSWLRLAHPDYIEATSAATALPQNSPNWHGKSIVVASPTGRPVVRARDTREWLDEPRVPNRRIADLRPRWSRGPEP